MVVELHPTQSEHTCCHDHTIEFSNLQNRWVHDQYDYICLREILAGTDGNISKIAFDSRLADSSDPRSFIDLNQVQYYDSDIIMRLQDYDIITKNEDDDWIFGTGTSVTCYNIKLAGSKKLAAYLDLQQVQQFRQYLDGYTDYLSHEEVQEVNSVIDQLEAELQALLQRTRKIANDRLVFQSYGKKTKSTDLNDIFDINYVSNYFEIRAALQDLQQTRRQLLSSWMHQYQIDYQRVCSLVDDHLRLAFGHSSKGYDYYLAILLPATELEALGISPDPRLFSTIQLSSGTYYLLVKSSEVKAYNGRTKCPTGFTTVDKHNIRISVKLPNLLGDKLIKYKSDRNAFQQLARLYTNTADDELTLFNHLLQRQEQILFGNISYHQIFNYRQLHKQLDKNAGDFGLLISADTGVEVFKLTFAEMEHFHNILEKCTTIKQFREKIKQYFDALDEAGKGLWTDRAGKIGFDRNIAGYHQLNDHIVGFSPGGLIIESKPHLRMERPITVLLDAIRSAPATRKQGTESIELPIPSTDHTYRIRLEVDHDLKIDPDSHGSAFRSALMQQWQFGQFLTADGLDESYRSSCWLVDGIDQNGTTVQIGLHFDHPVTIMAAYQRFEAYLFGESPFLGSSFIYYHRGNFAMDDTVENLDEMGSMMKIRSLFFGSYNGKLASEKIEEIDFDDVPDFTNVFRQIVTTYYYKYYNPDNDRIEMKVTDKRSNKNKVVYMQLSDFSEIYFTGATSRKIKSKLPFFYLIDQIEKLCFGNISGKKTHSGILSLQRKKGFLDKVSSEIKEIKPRSISQTEEIAKNGLSTYIEHIFRVESQTVSRTGYYLIDLLIHFLYNHDVPFSEAQKIIAKELLEVQIPNISNELFNKYVLTTEDVEQDASVSVLNMTSGFLEVILDNAISVDKKSFYEHLESIPSLESVVSCHLEKNNIDFYRKDGILEIEVLHKRWKNKRIINLSIEECISFFFQGQISRRRKTTRPFFLLYDLMEELTTGTNSAKQNHSGILSSHTGTITREIIIPKLRKMTDNSVEEVLELVFTELDTLIRHIFNVTPDLGSVGAYRSLDLMVNFVYMTGQAWKQAIFIVAKEVLFIQIPKLVEQYWSRDVVFNLQDIVPSNPTGTECH